MYPQKIMHTAINLFFMTEKNNHSYYQVLLLVRRSYQRRIKLSIFSSSKIYPSIIFVEREINFFFMTRQNNHSYFPVPPSSGKKKIFLPIL